MYLVQSPGQLSPDELNAHPEVAVVSTYDEFKTIGQNKVALWIDENAASLVQDGWLEEEPQREYPLVFVGISQPYIAFSRRLIVCCFSGPAMGPTPAPGYSIFQREFSEDIPFPRAYFIQGYDQPPTVADILAITTGLLDGTLQPTPTWTSSFQYPTPTPVPFLAPSTP